VDPASSQQTQKSDLGGHRDGHPERLDRGAHAGTLVEAEHLARYRWIATIASGRRVLDAGCGTAYGSEILALAGAREVVGVDRAGDVLDAVKPTMPEQVSLRVADLLELPFEDGSFDLVVCFEVLEHLEHPEAAIGELSRVLAADGLLAVSSPNREVFPPGNPHHVHEYLPEELRDSLARRFASVSLMRQHAWFASALVDDQILAADSGSEVSSGVAKAAGIAPGSEMFTIALASDAAIPELASMVVLGPEVDQRALREGIEAAEQQTQTIADQAARLNQLEAVRDQLVEAEQQLAELPALHGAKVELEAMRSSASWRLTSPLRRAKGPATRSLAQLRRRLKESLARFVAKLRDE
jgi:SAM-dependent methyltransferase